MKKRVKIPVSNAQSLLALARKVRDKHVADGEGSPLKVLNWGELNALIDDTGAVDERANDIKREKRKVYQLREHKLNDLRVQLRRSRDILTAVYLDEMKQLGSWGFDVLDNKVTPAAAESVGLNKTS